MKPACRCADRMLTIMRPRLFEAPTLNEKIAAFIRANGTLSARELEGKTGAARSSVNKALKELLNAQEIVRIGAGRSTRYRMLDGG